jgi:hypothetical protein
VLTLCTRRGLASGRWPCRASNRTSGLVRGRGFTRDTITSAGSAATFVVSAAFFISAAFFASAAPRAGAVFFRTFNLALR